MNRNMDKEDVLYLYHGILHSHKKGKTMPFETWMNIKSIMLSEISETEKDKYHKIFLIFGM